MCSALVVEQEQAPVCSVSVVETDPPAGNAYELVSEAIVVEIHVGAAHGEAEEARVGSAFVVEIDTPATRPRLCAWPYQSSPTLCPQLWRMLQCAVY